MKIDFPMPAQGMELAKLWQEAFGDTLEMIEGFFCTGYSPSRCRCVTIDEKVAAGLYWLDAEYAGQRFAYVYAVAVRKSHRGQGIGRALMEDTHAHLRLRGYDGVLLVPQSENLRQMYSKMGYRDCTTVSEFTCEAGEKPVSLHRIDRDTYAAARRDMLPPGSVIQEGENIAYLENFAFFYQGEDFLLAAHKENKTLRAPELLGNAAAAPGILKALNCLTGAFRTPGAGIPFAMFLPLKKDTVAPEYFGLAFD